MSYKAPWASPRNVPSLSTITLFFLLITRNACGRPRLKFAWVSSKSDSEISRELQCFTLKFNSVGWGYHEVYHFDRWLRIISAVVDFLSLVFYFLFHSFTLRSQHQIYNFPKNQHDCRYWPMHPMLMPLNILFFSFQQWQPWPLKYLKITLSIVHNQLINQLILNSFFNCPWKY